MTLPLMDALTIVHPTPRQTAFLQACLLRGEHLARVWPLPFAAPGGLLAFLRTDGRELRGHLPVLYRNLTSQGIDVPRALEPYLRAAVARAGLRHQQFQRCFEEALEALASVQVDVTVLKGAALARTTYPEPYLRHCHDLDLWVEAADAARGTASLQAHGWTERWSRRGTVCVEHAVGVPVLLHVHLLSIPEHALSTHALRDRRQRLNGTTGTWTALATPDALAHVLGHAATRGRRPHANWVVDAHWLSARMAAADWAILADDIDRAGVALPVLSLLAYLTDTLGTPVPHAVMDRIGRAARGAGGAQLLAAIDGARFGRPGGLGAMLGRAGWRSRWTIGRSLLLRRLLRGVVRRDNTAGREVT